MNLRATLGLKNAEALAGGPITLELKITNESADRVYFTLGHAAAGAFRFTITLKPQAVQLQELHPNAALFTGPMSAMFLDPGQTQTGEIVLNSSFPLEHTRAAMREGERATLDVQWTLLMSASHSSGYKSMKPITIEGELQIGLVRDDERLRQVIAATAAKLLNDAGAVPSDSVGRRDAILILSSLRIPEVAPYLQQLVDFPDFEVRRMAQQALDEVQHEQRR